MKRRYTLGCDLYIILQFCVIWLRIHSCVAFEVRPKQVHKTHHFLDNCDQDKIGSKCIQLKQFNTHICFLIFLTCRKHVDTYVLTNIHNICGEPYVNTRIHTHPHTQKNSRIYSCDLTLVFLKKINLEL